MGKEVYRVESVEVLSIRLPYSGVDLQIDKLGYFNFMLSAITSTLKSKIDEALKPVCFASIL